MKHKQLVAAASAGLIGLGLLGLAWSSHGAEPDKKNPAAFDYTNAVTVQQLREQALAVLATGLDSTFPEQRGNALEGLLPATQRAEPAIRKALKDVSPGVRAIAAMCVGKGKITRLAEELRPLLEDKSEFVRMAAIYGMAKCGVTVDQTPLAGYLLNSKNLKVKSQAAFTIGEIGNKSAIALLRDASQQRMGRSDPNEDRLMRLQIAEALVKLGDESAIDEIRAALYPAKSEDLEATALAAQILGLLRDRKAQKQLIELTTRVDDTRNRLPPEIRLAGAGALAKMGSPAGSTAIADEYRQSPVPGQRAQAAMVYGDTRDKANLGRLQPMLEDPEVMVRISAASAVLKVVDADPAR